MVTHLSNGLKSFERYTREYIGLTIEIDSETGRIFYLFQAPTNTHPYWKH